MPRPRLARTLLSIPALPLLALSLLALVLHAQEPARITGHVLGEDKSPIAGAVVSIPALGIGATTQIDGRYTLLVPAQRATGPATLSARAIGFRPGTFALTLAAGTTEHDFTLAANPLRLGEIVVTGAGTTSEVQKLTSVRNSVDSSTIARSNEPNIVNGLAAKAPNVEVISSSGDPGSSAAIRIRGTNTLTGTGEPLFIVDGVPIDNSTTNTESIDQSGYYLGGQGGTSSPNRASDIDPADVESIEVLKGAAAGAIYGARAGQGVILITTKHGRPGQTTYSLRSNLSIDKVSHTPGYQTTYGQGDNGALDACAQSDGPLDCYATPDSWGPKIAAGTAVYDHATDILTTGSTNDNALQIAGGNERTSFFLSGEYMKQRGIFVGPNNDYARSSVRFKGTHQITDKLSVGANVAYAYTNGNYVQKGSNYGGIYTVSLRSTPTFNNSYWLDTLAKLHRSYQFPHPSANSNGDTRGLDNPFFDAYVPANTILGNRVFGNINADFAPLSWLRIAYTLGVDHSGDQRLEGIPQTSADPPNALGQVIAGQIDHSQFDHNLVATASYTLSPSVSGTFAIGQNLNSRTFHIYGAIGDQLLAPLPYSLANTAQSESPLDRQVRIRDEGYFGQLTTDLWSSLFLKAGVRYDGSSTFGTGNLRNWFPSLSGAWQFTNSQGLFGGRISYGKLRLAYGEVGTEPSPYLTNAIYTTQNYADPLSQTILTARLNGLGGLHSSDTLATTGLKPERTKELETGVDLGFFHDRADAGFTWYRRTSTDVILPIPVAASSGASFESANGAELRNTGVEATLNVRAIATPELTWNIGVMFGHNKNTVVSLDGADFIPYGGFGGFGISVAPVGGEVGSFLDVDYVRCGRGVVLNDNGTPFDVDNACGATGVKDHALYIGTDGYPTVDPTKRIVGSPNPSWTGNVHSEIKWHKVTLSGLLDVRHGGLVYNGTVGYMNYYGTSLATLRRDENVVFGSTYMKGAVAGPGVGTSVVIDQNWFQNYQQSYAVGTPFYEDGSFVKLREISVAYTLQNVGITRLLGLSTIDLRAAGRNLHTWTKYTGADPETSLSGADSGASGIDWFNNPQTRSFVFTIALNR